MRSRAALENLGIVARRGCCCVLADEPTLDQSLLEVYIDHAVFKGFRMNDISSAYDLFNVS
jgi:hypothetical protein